MANIQERGTLGTARQRQQVNGGSKEKEREQRRKKQRCLDRWVTTSQPEKEEAGKQDAQNERQLNNPESKCR